MSIPAIAPYTMPVMDSGLNKVSWDLDPARAVLLIHDMQKYFMNFYDDSAEPVTSLIKNIQRIKKQCKKAGIPIIYTAQPGDQDPADRALLTDFWGTGLKDDTNLTGIIDPLTPDTEDHILTKWRYSAFKRNGMKQLLKELGKDQIIICGVYAHIGCMQSAADAFMYDIQAFMVSDALADFSRDEHQMALEYVAKRCGVTLDCETVLESLKPEKSCDIATRFMTDIADILYMSKDDLDPDISLVDQGLDSIRTLTLIEKWQTQGVDISFAELAEHTRLNSWLELLKAKAEKKKLADNGALKRNKVLPLTHAQAGLWQELDCSDSALFNTGECIEIKGPIDPSLFEQALRQVVAETDALHVSFALVEHRPVQIFSKNESWELHFVDFSDHNSPWQSIRQWINKSLQKLVNLFQGPLFTQALFKTGNDHFYWYQGIHHMVMDGYGYALITKRVAEVYTALLEGEELSRQFDSLESVIAEEADYQASEKKQQDADFWQKMLSQIDHIIALTTEDIAINSTFIREKLDLAPAHIEKIKSQSQSLKASWSDLVIAIIATWTYRRSQHRELVFGLAVMGRTGARALRTPAMMMNMVPFRIYITDEMTFTQLLEQVQQRFKEIRPHQHYRYEQLKEELLKLKGHDRLFGPLINIMPFDTDIKFGGIPAMVHKISEGPVEDLAIGINARGDGCNMVIDLDADPACYRAATLTKFKQELIDTLTSCLADPSQAI